MRPKPQLQYWPDGDNHLTDGEIFQMFVCLSSEDLQTTDQTLSNLVAPQIF